MNAHTGQPASVQMANKAADFAILGALAYLQKEGKQTLENCDALADPLKRHVKDALPAALKDAKDAIDCGMSAIASQTFAASMRRP